MGETILGNERDTDELAKALGLTKVFNSCTKTTNSMTMGPEILRERMIFLIRLLKIDTVVCYDPWGLYEENPDHVATARPCSRRAGWRLRPRIIPSTWRRG